MTGPILAHGQRRRLGLAVAASLMLVPLASAQQLTLADLLDNPDASFRSRDGQVEFSDFAYEGGTGAAAAPSNQSIRIIPSTAATGGFQLEGPFQALNGGQTGGTLSFTASAVSGLGFDRAWLRLGSSSAYGFSNEGNFAADSAYVRLVETISAVEGEAHEQLSTLHDAIGDGSRFITTPLNPDLFGSTVRVSQDLELQSLRGQGPSVSILSSYVFGLNVVPEPGTALLLLAAGGACVLSLRRSRR